ncbi:Pyruvate dehydrogenase E1 component subunit alpha, mitochondrial [Smittium culicis]|uniref:Pyruvate dehydrogenase E1 component subunit alpha n=2 Tax=Smittium culicis TaxID=133412 RepID=A0A1R1YDM1_9FUNG|nr:Pyruvate dehydrogenase E1 component subunit alpha, mitochondrial [Smittium culicis]OMJ24966.1 Pyruvate dehydrogenase E1 component subunit alpha, mitochondrial [Smittium culicis]
MSSDANVKLNFNISSESFIGHRMEVLPSLDIELTKTEALDMYFQMQMVRRLEMAADAAYKAKMIRGFCHLCTGQEAIPVGVEFGLSKKDSVITSYRCHGFTYVRGVTPTKILAELMGRRDGCSKGKGGSMHMFGPNFYGGNGIVGAQVPLGAGIAFTHKYLNDGACNVALYGDGAANQGQVFEAFNIAKLWDLPVIFVCENNKYGMGTSANRAAMNTDYYTRGDVIPGIKVNGMDILAVREAIKFSKEFTTSGKGPIVLEMSTYRYGGHSMSDPGTTYRTRDEIQHMRSTSDPITGYKTRLLETNLVNEDELKALEKESKKLIDAATAEAKASPEPEVSELFTEVYANTDGIPSLRGRSSSEIHYY